MNVSKPVFVSAILLGLISGLMVSQVFSAMAVGGHYRGNPLHEIWEAITELQTRVGTLEDQSPPQGFVTAPAYDSGWLSIEPDVAFILTHNLDTPEVFVYVTGKSDLYGVHQNNYGGNLEKGVTWYGLNSTSIMLVRHDLDINAASQWNYVRVMIWKISD